MANMLTFTEAETDIIVRYLGGDETLIGEIQLNREARINGEAGDVEGFVHSGEDLLDIICQLLQSDNCHPRAISEEVRVKEENQVKIEEARADVAEAQARARVAAAHARIAEADMRITEANKRLALGAGTREPKRQCLGRP